MSFIPVARMTFLLRYCLPSWVAVMKYEPFPVGTMEVTVPLVIETEVYTEICSRANARKVLGTVPSLPMTSCICCVCALPADWT